MPFSTRSGGSTATGHQRLTPLLDAYEAKYAFRPDPGASQDDAWFLLLPSTVVCWNEADFVNSQVRYRFG